MSFSPRDEHSSPPLLSIPVVPLESRARPSPTFAELTPPDGVSTNGMWERETAEKRVGKKGV